jgi:hypothetical protein
MVTCPNCRADNDWKNPFCDQCGALLANVAPTPIASVPPSVVDVFAAPICPQCGQQSLPGEAFCDNCGAPLSLASGSYVPNVLAQLAEQRSSPPPPPVPLDTGAGNILPLAFKLQRTLGDKQDEIYQIAWPTDGRILAWISKGGVKFWNMESGEAHTIPSGILQESLYRLAWSPDGKILALSSYASDDQVWLYDVELAELRAIDIDIDTRLYLD